MDKILWAPWRETFIYDRRPRRCIFCLKPKQKKDVKNFIFMRRRHTFAMLNLYPYNNGHVMVVPFRHVKTLETLRPAELSALIRHIRDVKKVLTRVLKPHGFNVGLNEGRAGGAGYKGHIHFHLVPRWNGDTNFMPVLAGSKVLSESLEALYQKVCHAHPR